MFNTLENIIKKCKGNVLAICLDGKLMNELNKKEGIGLISIESNVVSGIGVKTGKKKKLNGTKNISIKKLRKYIKKKSVDTLFCNMNEMNNYYKYFIKDSIYLCCDTVYLYFNNDVDLEFIENKYKRYKTVIKSTKYKNGYIVKVDVSNAKNNWFKDKLYLLHDTLYNIIELIGNILVG